MYGVKSTQHYIALHFFRFIESAPSPPAMPPAMPPDFTGAADATATSAALDVKKWYQLICASAGCEEYVYNFFKYFKVTCLE